MKACIRLMIFCCIVFLLVACNQVVQNQPEPQSTASLIVTTTSTPAPTNTPTLFNTATRVPIPTHVPSKTATPTHEPVDISQIGTSLPQNAQVISPENIHKLMQVGQWGYGAIDGAAFTPDGKQFIVSSDFGFAIYNMNDLQSAPDWVSFPVPSAHNYVLFNDEGTLLRFVTNNDYVQAEDLILTYPDGSIVKETKDAVWLNPVFRSDRSYTVNATSNDGTKIFSPHTQIAEDRYQDETTSHLQVLDANTDNLLLTLQDETLVRSFEERTSPQGCDVFWTGACGTSNIPISYLPYHAAFSPDDSTLAVMYYIWYEYSPVYENLGFVRIYDASTGMLLQSFGDPNTYTPAFTYSPDSKYLLVAHNDGSIELWNTLSQETTFTAWHFNGEAKSLEYVSDGNYVLIQRQETLEIRSAFNGALRARLNATLYDISPVDDNIIAYADKENNIKLFDVAKSDNILTIPAHEDVIFDVQISPDGIYIASSSQDCTVKLWDAKTGEFLHYFEETIVDSFDHYTYANMDPERLTRIFIRNLAFVEGSQSLFGFNNWRITVKWNLDSGATDYVTYFTPEYDEGFRVDLSANQILFSNKIYNFETGEEIGEGEYPSRRNGRAYINGDLNYLEFDYDADAFYLYLYNTQDDAKITSIKLPNATPEKLYISPDETTLFIQTYSGNYLVYQIVE